MGAFFTRERFGRPQVLAGFLLLVFLVQCVWLVARDLQAGFPEPDETFRIEEGLRQWRHEPDRVWIAGSEALGMQMWMPPELDDNQDWDPNHSPLWYLVASAPLLAWPGQLQPESFHLWGWLARAPYLVFGVLLGASLWYVSRRLYGNAGGYIALSLYCFSPGTIRGSALWFSQPELGAAWGTFGAIFTAIAVTHTLYAPREVVLWNWRRIFLLGLSLVLAVGSQFSLVIVVPMALGFMLYLAPARRAAAVAIWSAGCATALFLLLASYFFHGNAFWLGIRHARFFGFSGRAFGMSGAYRQVLAQLGQSSPALVLAIPAALITYVAWPRARYFGNTAPLLVAVLFLVMGLGTPHYPGLGFQLMAIPFLFVFVAGIAADLLETRHRSLALACVWGLLMANAMWNLLELARAGRG